jgi:hypothetical protein
MKLIDDWAAQLRKAWSIRLAGLAGVVGAYFVAFPSELDRLTGMLPESYREPFALLAGLFIFATASGARLVKQGREE